jgi:hypothetical protein
MIPSNKININFKALPHQAGPYKDSITQEIFFAAGLGAGKTRTLCEKILSLSWLNRGFQGGVLAPSFPDYYKDIEPCLLDEVFPSHGLRENRHWFYTRDRSRLSFRFSWNMKRVYIFSAEKAIAGPNLAWGLINEPSLIPYKRIREMINRVRVKAPNRQIGMFGTPEDRHLWLDEYLESRNKMNETRNDFFKLYQGNTRDNVHLNKEYYETLKSTYDSKAQQVFLEGKIVRINSESFYYAFSREKIVSELAERKNDLIVYANMDFNVGRMTATFANKLGEHTHYFDSAELLGNSDTRQMGEYIKTRYGVNVIITMDASGKNRKTSGASDYQLLIECGFPKENIRFKSQNPRFRERQLLVNGRMDNGKILIHPRCKVLINDLERVEQNKLTFEKIKDKDGKLTHASDTMDYFEDYEFTIYVGRQSKTIQL